jgi:hypothetical protein
VRLVLVLVLVVVVEKNAIPCDDYDAHAYWYNTLGSIYRECDGLRLSRCLPEAFERLCSRLIRRFGSSSLGGVGGSGSAVEGGLGSGISDIRHSLLSVASGEDCGVSVGFGDDGLGDVVGGSGDGRGVARSGGAADISFFLDFFFSFFSSVID